MTKLSLYLFVDGVLLWCVYLIVAVPSEDALNDGKELTDSVINAAHIMKMQFPQLSGF